MASVMGTQKTIRTGSGGHITGIVVGYYKGDDGSRVYQVQMSSGRVYHGPRLEES